MVRYEQCHRAWEVNLWWTKKVRDSRHSNSAESRGRGKSGKPTTTPNMRGNAGVPHGLLKSFSLFMKAWPCIGANQIATPLAKDCTSTALFPCASANELKRKDITLELIVGDLEVQELYSVTTEPCNICTIWTSEHKPHAPYTLLHIEASKSLTGTTFNRFCQ